MKKFFLTVILISSVGCGGAGGRIQFGSDSQRDDSSGYGA